MEGITPKTTVKETPWRIAPAREPAYGASFPAGTLSALLMLEVLWG
jgi:hypothetical protein